MNQYETVIIVTPVLSESEVKKVIAKYTDLLKENGAEMVGEEPWGMKQLAYPIQRKTTGIYHILEYKVDGSVIDKLELMFRRDEVIMRFLTIRLDTFSIEYNDKKRKGLIGVKKDKVVEVESEATPAK